MPLVVVPTAHDKPDNARRVVEAGAGVRVSPRACTPARLRAAVEEVLGEGRYRAAAAALGERLRAGPGPAGGATLLEGLVGAARGEAASVR